VQIVFRIRGTFTSWSFQAPLELPIEIQTSCFVRTSRGSLGSTAIEHTVHFAPPHDLLNNLRRRIFLDEQTIVQWPSVDFMVSVVRITMKVSLCRIPACQIGIIHGHGKRSFTSKSIHPRENASPEIDGVPLADNLFLFACNLQPPHTNVVGPANECLFLRSAITVVRAGVGEPRRRHQTSTLFRNDSERPSFLTWDDHLRCYRR
jgi:hypothetical protein